MNEIMTMRTELANQFAAAGAKLLDFTMTAGALAAIPNTMPQQYAVAGTLESIQKVLPAAEPSHPQRRQKHGDRPSAADLDWDEATSRATAPHAGPAPADYVLMPRTLTAENGAKGALSGEFSESCMVLCIACDGTGNDDDSDNDAECPECKGDGEVEQRVTVGWDTIKRIYEAAVGLLAAPAGALGAKGEPCDCCKDIWAAESAAVPAEPAGWREFITNIATPYSEPLNSISGYKDKASRQEWMAVLRTTARELLAAHQPTPTKGNGDTDKGEGHADQA